MRFHTGNYVLHSSLLVDVPLLLVLVFLSALVIRRFVRTEDDSRWLRRLVWISLLLHLLASLAQIVIIAGIYNNVSDYLHYESIGAYIAHQITSGAFDFSGLQIPGNDMVGLILGLVFLVTGVDKLAGFLVFSWIGFLGLLAFYRAFRTVLPNADHRRYGYLIFLLPSLIFWSAPSGKEALMLGCIGLATLGVARLLSAQRGGLLMMAVGLALSALFRPHETLMVFGAAAIAYLLRRSAKKSLLGPLRWVGTIVLLGGGLALLTTVAAGFLDLNSLSPSAVSDRLEAQANVTSSVEGVGGGSNVDYTWSANPLDYPKDLYYVFAQPLPWQAENFPQQVAALENVVIALVIVASARRLWRLPRELIRQPYLMYAALHSLVFVYVISSLGNLGLLDRERILLFPLFFVLLSLPKRAEKRQLAPASTATDVLLRRFPAQTAAQLLN
jgi:4-amino-4-deoxy-L-arabinose transferase-like glycosyltransferase